MIPNPFTQFKEKWDNRIDKRSKKLLLLALDGIRSHKDFDQRSSDWTLIIDCLMTMNVLTEDEISDYIINKHSPKNI